MWLLFLDQSGGVKSYTRISSGSSGFTFTVPANDGFGDGSVTLSSDLNRDGVLDLTKSSPLLSENSGALYICFLKDSGTVLSATKIVATTSPLSVSPGAHFGRGHSVHTGADLDSDGTPELFSGSAFAGTAAGRVTVVFLNPTFLSVKSATTIAPSTSSFTASVAASDWFGWSVTVTGDLNGDSCVEMLVGAPYS